nr:MAG TPA_asm: hypothetical protein [Caudoviricetes sp.]
MIATGIKYFINSKILRAERVRGYKFKNPSHQNSARI